MNQCCINDLFSNNDVTLVTKVLECTSIKNGEFRPPFQSKYFSNFIYRILRTIGRYFFSSTRWLRPIVHIDLYKDEVKKIWNP